MTALDVPKKWFVANVDKVIAVYGEKHKLEKEDVFLGMYSRCFWGCCGPECSSSNWKTRRSRPR